MVKLSAPSSFIWSTSEQVYSLEKGINNATLYGRKVDLGALTGGWKTVALPFIPDTSKIFQSWGYARQPGGQTVPFNYVNFGGLSSSSGLYFDNGSVTFGGGDNNWYSNSTGVLYIIYSK